MTPVIDNVGRLLSDLNCRWCFCGGWAIDLFLGFNTRVHKDIDVAILRTDQHVVWTFLNVRNWVLQRVDSGSLIPWREGDNIEPPLHEIHCHHASFVPSGIEFLLNESDGKQLLFRRDKSICRSLEEAILVSKKRLAHSRS